MLEDSTSRYLKDECNIELVAGEANLQCRVPKKGHMRTKTENQEFVTLTCIGMKKIGNAAAVSQNLKTRVIREVNKALDERFTSFITDIFKKVFWLDPAKWSDSVSEVAKMKLFPKKIVFMSTRKH